LREPCRRNIPGIHGEDDPVVGGVRRIPRRAVTGDDVNIRQSDGSEMRAGNIGDVRVNIHSRDMSGGADECAEQGGVVPGARADLQHIHARLERQLLEHFGDHRGLRGAGNRDVTRKLRRDSIVRVGTFE